MRTGACAMLLALATVGCLAPSPQLPRSRAFPLKDRSDIEQAVRDHYAARQQPVTLTEIELFRFPSRSNLYAAICEWETDWWGEMLVFEFDEGRINWVAAVDQPPVEQSILSIRPAALPGFEGPCLEVFGISHMGHGNMYLYTVNGPDRRLEQVLATFAVDRHQDGTLIRGDRLVPVYHAPGPLRRAGNIVLVGIVDQYQDGATDGDPGMPVKSRRARKVFYFDNALGRYVSDPEQWQGMGPYEGRP